ncbi:ABC transporter substrate-binding protein [Arthrobacter sp. KK5.5]|uniref:ABC transporter substrate-binding protein n=1 Tax=Arthrobacter sp. KK5.5 TaxID=3373084 RepID=UPI003EE4921E
MSQPIDVGTVLGGRYKVSGVVLASADGDVVLDGTDQVLNREVSILVASAENASQVATSAREIATGERYGAMQVLDLGISDGTTYLITNTAAPADLLDLVIQRDEPFVEPFYTDTLGSEIFGESRSMEPHVYEDDDEYYEELRAQEQNRPGMIDRLPEINLTDRLSGFKSRFAKGRNAPGSGDDAATGGAAAGGAAGAAGASAAAAANATASGAGAAGAADPAARVPPRPTEAPRSAADSSPADHGAATQAQPEAPQPPAAAHPTSSKVSIYDADDFAADEAPSHRHEPRDDTNTPPTAGTAAASAAGAAGVGAGAGAPGSPPAEDGGLRKASVFPAGARSFQDPAETADYADDEYEDASSGGRKGTRLLVGAVLAILLIVAVVFAFNNLGPGEEPGPVAGTSSAPAASEDENEGGSAESSAAPESSEAPVVEPRITGLSRLVPGNQALNAETDATLVNAIDGSQGSMYRSYSFTQPQFGGFASNMVLVVELEEESDVSSVELSGLNGTGGAFEIRIGDTNDLGSAREITSGSFTGPTVTVPVAGDDGGPAKAQYVFINVTELPRLASGSNNSRPYGLQVAEIKVS